MSENLFQQNIDPNSTSGLNNQENECMTYFREIRNARLEPKTFVEKATQIKRLANKLNLHSNEELYDSILTGSLQSANELENVLLRPKDALFSGSGMFRHLSELILPDIITHNKDTKSISFWVPGCRSGLEAYSIALFLNAQKKALSDWDLKLLATDTSNIGLKKAQTATIPVDDIDPVINDLYGHGLKKVDDNYIIKEDVRKLVTFSNASFFSPPSDRALFDVIVFRNHLKFWIPEHQETIINVFASCLKPGGYLVLGNSEALMGLTKDFRPIHGVSGFYQFIKV